MGLKGCFIGLWVFNCVLRREYNGVSLDFATASVGDGEGCRGV